MLPTFVYDYLFDKCYFDPTSGCWLWIRARTWAGYGKAGFGDKILAVHRMIWELNSGDIPDGRILCHKCDTPPCCNPDHMYVGTFAENSEEMMQRGRGNKQFFARTACHTKLSKEQVIEIRKSSQLLGTIQH